MFCTFVGEKTAINIFFIVILSFEYNFFVITSEKVVGSYLVSGGRGGEGNYPECPYEMAIGSFI